MEKKIIDYFRSNIFESFSAYNAWKMISFSKSSGVVSEEMAERYLKIQKYHENFFILAERAFLINFVLLSLHAFDKRDDSYSLYKIDELETKKFIDDNQNVIEQLKNLRHKLFAHRDLTLEKKEYTIPSVDSLDKFFDNLIIFYNKLTDLIDNSRTQFTNATNIKHDVDFLFQNLYRGENIRKLEIEINWHWEKNEKKGSKII